METRHKLFAGVLALTLFGGGCLGCDSDVSHCLLVWNIDGDSKLLLSMFDNS
jgi:hypothetical protein